VADARKFIDAGRFAARAKPVLLVKGGRSQAGAKAAFSHTRALAGADAVYSAAFRRAGILQLDGLDELLDTALAFSRSHRTAPRTLAILTNGGGAGRLAADALDRAGGGLTPFVSGNPGDLARPASAQWGRRPTRWTSWATPRRRSMPPASRLCSPRRTSRRVLVINCPTAVADSGLAAEAVIAAAQRAGQARACGLAGLRPAVADGRARLNAACVQPMDRRKRPCGRLPGSAKRAGCTTSLREAPDGGDGDVDVVCAREIVAKALAAGRDALDPLEVQGVLQAYGVPILETPSWRTPAEAGAAAAAIALRWC
jgi:acetyltransferase